MGGERPDRGHRECKVPEVGAGRSPGEPAGACCDWRKGREGLQVGLRCHSDRDGKLLEGSEWRSDGVSPTFAQGLSVLRMDSGGGGKGGLLGGWGV